LGEKLERRPWSDAIEFEGGLGGCLIYALERRHTDVGARSAAQAIARLAELAEPRSNGLAWRTPPAFIHPDLHPERFTAGFYDLGAAHGIPGILPGIAGCAAAGIEREASLG